MTPQQEAAALRHFSRLMSELGQSLQIDTPVTRGQCPLRPESDRWS
jgi:hypothetical protein